MLLHGGWCERVARRGGTLTPRSGAGSLAVLILSPPFEDMPHWPPPVEARAMRAVNLCFSCVFTAEAAARIGATGVLGALSPARPPPAAARENALTRGPGAGTGLWRSPRSYLRDGWNRVDLFVLVPPPTPPRQPPALASLHSFRDGMQV